MRSEILKIYDVKKAVGEWQWTAVPDESAVQENMYQVGLKYRSYGSVGTVCKGDIVTVEMKSGIKKFDRCVKLNVGSNMFDRAFESELIGKNAGASYIFADERGGVSYTVRDVVRLIVPAVSDEMARAEGIEGVFTREQLYEYFRRRSVREKLAGEAFAFSESFVENCDFRIDDGDIEQMCEYEMERCRGISAAKGMVFDEMSREQLLGAVGCENISQFKEMIRAYFNKTLRIGLVNTRLEGVSGEMLTCSNIPEHCARFRSKIVDIVSEASARRRYI